MITQEDRNLAKLTHRLDLEWQEKVGRGLEKFTKEDKKMKKKYDWLPSQRSITDAGRAADEDGKTQDKALADRTARDKKIITDTTAEDAAEVDALRGVLEAPAGRANRRRASRTRCCSWSRRWPRRWNAT